MAVTEAILTNVVWFLSFFNAIKVKYVNVEHFAQ